MAASSKHHVRNRILGGLGAVILVVVGFFMWQKTKVQLYDDPNTTGNTAGNLLNGGKFCEADGRIYYADPYDNDSLYVTDDKLQKSTKLHGDTVSYLNVAGDYIFYTRRNDRKSVTGGNVLALSKTGLFRLTTDGKNMGKLYDDPTQSVCLYGNYLYYQRYNNKDFTKFYKLKTDKSENLLISDDIINPASCDNGIIYYNGQDKDHYLYALDTRTDTSSVIYEGDLWFPVYKDGYVYYMDVGNNYQLCRYSLYDQSVEVLTTDRVDFFNVGNTYIYYQKVDSASPALMRMRFDGSEQEVVAEGNYSNINITSQYVYFNEFNTEVPVYHTPESGPVSVSTFDGARNAAITSVS